MLEYIKLAAYLVHLVEIVYCEAFADVNRVDEIFKSSISIIFKPRGPSWHFSKNITALIKY